MFIEVGILENVGTHSIFTYASDEPCQVGDRVLVPFGPRKLDAYVLRGNVIPDIEISRIRKIIEIREHHVLLPLQIELALWMAKKYGCSLSSVLKCIAPTGQRIVEEIEVYAALTSEQIVEAWPTYDLQEAEVMEKFLNAAGDTQFVRKNAIVKRLIKKTHLVATGSRIRDKINAKQIPETIIALHSIDQLESFKSKTRSIYMKEILGDLISENCEISYELEAAKGDQYKRSIQALKKKDIIEVRYTVLDRSLPEDRNPYPKPERLTDEQLLVISTVDKRFAEGQRRFLLHGVTGSGKTEIYLHLIEDVLLRGQDAIVLVPEISLTPQTANRFCGRFGEKVVILHSALSAGERYDAWNRIKNSSGVVVLGTRSAIFSPLAKPGIIIIDEEHEDSYRQDSQPNYKAHEVAEFISQKMNIPLILSSATPSVESYQAAREGKIQIIRLTKRATGGLMPDIHIQDLRQEITAGNISIFSKRLQNAIRERLLAGEQVILFVNRRGFADFILCRSCGLTIKCPHCDVSLTYHRESGLLKCHYCFHVEKAPTVCPACKSPYIRQFGVGTQKVEEEVNKLFPAARTIRMDYDTTRKKGAYDRIINCFAELKADILIGTQMVAKGHDFPCVTLVGIINADTQLSLPDYRAGEKTYQLFTQVSGRAGRSGKRSEVIIQTYKPNHHSFKAIIDNDFEEFFKREIEYREAMSYPPFCEIVRYQFSSADEENAKKMASQTARILRSDNNIRHGIAVIGPAPSALKKIRDAFIWQLYLKIPVSLSDGLKFVELETALKKMPEAKNVKIKKTIDPFGLT